MGNTHSNSNARLAGVGNLVAEVGNDIQYDKGIGNSRFLRAVRARHRFGPIVVKTFVKPDPSMSLKSLVKHIRIERESLADVPNVLTYQKVVETERAGYLIRQWLHSNLYDRISTRPFLSSVEKRWITYQLLHAMRDAHERNIAHGDLKCENILVTTSLMIYVTDFASSFKPTYLPLDDPSDFSYFFDTSGRRTCYLAPERFYEAGSKYASADTGTSKGGDDVLGRLGGLKTDLLGLGRQSGKVTQAMDVFSLGCVIAELWREGAPTFTLSQLFKYREGLFDVDAMLATIPDEPICELVRNMIALDPADRKTFDQCLANGHGKVFPAAIPDFFHEYLVELQRTSPAASNQGTSAIGTSSVESATTGSNASTTAVSLRSEASNRQIQRAESDERIEKLYEEWSTIMHFFDQRNDRTDSANASTGPSSNTSARLNGVLGRFAFQSSFHQPHEGGPADNERSTADDLDDVFPLHLCIPGLPSQKALLDGASVDSDGTALLVLPVILANIRNCIRPSSKCHALELLVHLSTRWLTDETKLDRVLPYIMSLFDDPSSQVRMAAIRCCVQTLMLVRIVTPSNASIFPEYIVPNIKQLSLDPSTPVRCTFAACIVPFAEIAERFLQMSQAMRAEGLFAVERDLNGGFIEDQPNESNYDEQLRTIQALLQEIIVTLLTDPSASVKRALLSSIAPLCRFFGMAKTNDVMLSHMITYLNDRNWLLREAFFDIIVDVAEVSGHRSLEEYVLPLMTQALSDSEENVVYRVINGLRTMTERGLLDRARLLALLDTTLGFLCHPNLWLRQASAGLTAAAAARLDDVDVWAILYPSLRPLLRADVQELSEIALLDMAKTPLTRPVFSGALAWASQASKSAFWKGPTEGLDQAGLKNGLATEGVGLLLGRSGRELIVTARGRSEEDDRFRDKLRGIGMEDDDEVKLLALRSIIRRLSKQGFKSTTGHTELDSMRPTSSADQNAEGGRSHPKAVIEPQSLDGITPQTIFFSTNVDQRTTPAASEAASTYTGTLRSQDDGSFFAQVAKRRLLGHRTSSEGSLAGPIADIRRRMTAVSIANSQPSTFSTRLSSLTEEHTQSKHRTGATAPGPPSPLSHQAQARLGVGKATAAVASAAVTATGTMTEASARARALHAAAAQGSAKATPSGSRASTVRGNGGGEAGKLGAAGGMDSGSGAVFTSTYDGNDPYIRAHLEAVYFDSFRDRPELGPKIHAGVARRKGGAPWNRGSALPRAPTSSTSKRRPEGRLIAYFTEHSAAVTCLALSPDHTFFVSGSLDGTLKVWDTARLEKNVTSKSRATYSAQKGSITGVIAIEGSHCVASTATDGSLHVWRIDLIQSTSSVPRYGKPKLVSNFQLSTPDEYATCLVQTSTDTSSHLILGTTLSRLTILDLRTMQVLQTLRNPVEYGPITCLCADKRKAWLLVGTMTGVVCLWDLRFGLRLRAWHVGLNEAGTLHRVNRIAIHPSKGRGRWVFIAFEKPGDDAGSDQPEVIVETWDIDRGIRVETFETLTDAAHADSAGPSRSTKLKAVLDSDDARVDTSVTTAATERSTSSRHDSMLTGAAAAIERLLQQQQTQIRGEDQTRSSHADATDVDPFESRPQGGAARPQGTSSSGTSVQSCSVKALFVSLEGYSSSSLSSAAAAVAAATTKAPGHHTEGSSEVGDGTETIHAETGGGWLDVGKLARDTDRLTISPSAAAQAKAAAAHSVAALNGGGSGPGGYMITAGCDAKLRFWDLGKPEKSLVFGVAPRVVQSSSTSSASTLSQGRASSSSAIAGGVMVAIDPRSEFRSVPPPAGTAAPARVLHSMWYGEDGSAEEAGRASSGTRLKSPLLANQTAVYAHMSRAHKDAVTDVLVIESPFRCVVAADRSGCIRVWE